MRGCGGIGRRTRLRIQRLYGVGVRLPSPAFAEVVQWQNTTLPRWGSRVRIPSFAQRGRGGGTGRRTGLKILRLVTIVPVRFRSSAYIDGHPQLNWIEYLTTNQAVRGSTPLGCIFLFNAGSSSAWQSTWFGTKVSQVRILSSRSIARILKGIFFYLLRRF